MTYTLLDENTLLMDLEINGQQMSHTFRLGEEHVMKKNDGGTVCYILDFSYKTIV